MTQAFAARLSPSGPIIGTPPALVGGGATVPGRVWLAQGTGAVANVPGPTAAAIAGLTAIPVDMKPGATGYKYDLEFDVNTFGTASGFSMILAGSTDGVTYTAMYVPQGLQQTAGLCRLHLTNFANPNATPIKFISGVIARDAPAGSSLTYAPVESSVRVREYSAS